MNTCRFFVLSFLLFGAALLTGCGSDLKLAVVTAEGEDVQHAAELARSVEVSYHDANGNEQMKEVVPVPALSQGQTIRPEIKQKLSWDRDGVFEAKAFSADGVMVLRGQVQADPEKTDSVQIMIGREGKDVSKSASIRKITLERHTGLLPFSASAEVLGTLSGSQKCLEIPGFSIRRLPDGKYPRLVVETVDKAPQLQYVIGSYDEAGRWAPWGSRSPLPVLSNGYAGLEFNSTFQGGILLGGPVAFAVQVYAGDKYEGCVSLRTEPAIGQLDVQRVSEEQKYPIPAFSSDIQSFAVVQRTTSVVHFRIRNPNDYAMTAVWRDEATLHHCTTLSGNDIDSASCLTPAAAGPVREVSLFFAPGEVKDVFVYGIGSRLNYSPVIDLNWSLKAKPTLIDMAMVPQGSGRIRSL